MNGVMRLLSDLYEDPLILRLAGYLLVCQLVLTVFFKFVPLEGPWKQTALFSGKQVIVIGLMVYQTYLGFVYWSQEEYDYGVNPPLAVVEEDVKTSKWDGGTFMARLVLGTLLYDIPVGALTGSVDVMMHMHHFGMFTVASIAMGIWTQPHAPLYTRYCPFFFGVVELSSIPLTIVDIFHPKKQPEWFQFAQNHPIILQINEIARISFAILYILLRMVYFPRVITRQVVPEALAKLNNPQNEHYKIPILVGLIFSVLFTLLQLYWGENFYGNNQQIHQPRYSYTGIEESSTYYYEFNLLQSKYES
ncbi:expressed unknown protein [Seminavis robusta]|uniref:TLC domain-containing protein n=1 Tax=Seminavis robusta TaxID=568900 RepID=A0A9N8ES03_9STRA|nr:expressed unknown protein [Seminavis robusta]|eukprot:Sro1666_g289700.1 n/a (305) ;mRNA; f:13044-14146